MTDDLALDDATCDAQARADRPPPPSDPWLRRRLLTFGASQVYALLVALERRPRDTLPSWQAPLLRRPREWQGEGRAPAERLFLIKAGLCPVMPGPKPGSPPALGIEREERLLAAWLARGPTCDVMPATVRHASTVPKGWWPLVDHECHSLAVTPDAWGADFWSGRQVVIELKCTVHPWLGATPPHYVAQVQAQMGAMGASRALLVGGMGWALPNGASGPVHVREVARDDAMIAEIRDACREGWARVEELRAAWPEGGE